MINFSNYQPTVSRHFKLDTTLVPQIINKGPIPCRISDAELFCKELKCIDIHEVPSKRFSA